MVVRAMTQSNSKSKIVALDPKIQGSWNRSFPSNQLDNGGWIIDALEDIRAYANENNLSNTGDQIELTVQLAKKELEFAGHTLPNAKIFRH